MIISLLEKRETNNVTLETVYSVCFDLGPGVRRVLSALDEFSRS